jgi:type II secretory pathway component PulF
MPVVTADTNFVDPQIVDGSSQVKQLMEAMEKEGLEPESLLNAHFLFASLFWGSVGAGYLLYARRQRMVVPFIGGVAMIAVSYFISSWVWMSVVCIALIVGVYQLVKRGY